MAIVSLMSGSPTNTGWKRRSSAASFSMCLRYSSSVVAPTARSSPRASIGFSKLAASTAPSAAPAPTIVCSSSMKRTIWPSASWTFLQHRLQALLELASVLRPGEQGADVERDHPAIAQRLGDVALDDALGEALDDRGLADAGIADQDGVVLRPPRQHLDHAANLLVAADHRVELASPRLGGEVATELLQRLRHLLGIRRGHAAWALRLGDGLGQRLAVGQQVGGRRGLVRQRQEQVADGDVLVTEGRRLLLGPLQHREKALRRPGLRLGVAADRGQLGDRGLGPLGDRGDVGGQLAQRSRGETILRSSNASNRCGGTTSGLRAATARRCASATASWDLMVNRSACMLKASV